MTDTEQANLDVVDTAPSSVDESTLAAIRKQIEFYFGDSNYPRDKFLLSQARKHPEFFIQLEVLATFNRLKVLTSDISVMAKALEGSDIVTLSEDKTMIKRAQKMPDNDVTLPKCIHAESFPEDTDIDALQKFFSEYGTVISVRRIVKDKKFTGAAFIEFDSEEKAKEVLAKSISYKENALTLTYKPDWVKANEEVYNKLPPSVRGGLGKRKREGKNGDEAFVVSEEQKGKILYLQELPSDITFGQIKDKIKALETVNYVDNDNPEKVLVRMETAEGAKKVVEALKENTEIFGKAISAGVLEGDEELEYWKKVKRAKDARQKKQGKKGYKKHRK